MPSQGKTRPMHPSVAADYLVEKYGFEPDTALRAVRVAHTQGLDAEPIELGLVEISHLPTTDRYVIEEFSHPKSSRRVAGRAAAGYDSALRHNKSPRRNTTMPPRGRAAVAEPEPEVEESATDYTVYADKDITPVMEDFATWIIDEVYNGEYTGDEDAFIDGIRLGGTLRMEFQRSDFCKEQRELRRKEREEEAAKKAAAKKTSTAKGKGAAKAAAEPDEDDEDEPEEKPAPKPRGRAAAKPAATKPAGRGRAATAPATKPTARRGRGAAKAAAEPEADSEELY